MKDPTKLGEEHLVDVIIPTLNNIDQLMACVCSVCCHTQSRGIMRVIVVNNGDPEAEKAIQKHQLIRFFNAGKNLGWEGGLKYGLERSTSEFVMFLNDDTYIPYSSSLWLLRMLNEFRDPKVGMVGPSSNVVAGKQNIFLNAFSGPHTFEVPFLIGFCVLVRRSALDAVGGIDDTLPGGDDFDLSIRMRKAGYRLICAMDAFVYHHGFQTGVRMFGGPDKPGGWNSTEMQERTNNALIRKHGFKTFMESHTGAAISADTTQPSREEEGDVVKQYVKPGIVVELGCGATKTVPDSIGVDIIAKGYEIPTLEHAASVADVQADVTKRLPFESGYADTVIARHILEHTIDPLTVLREWARILKPDGCLIIAVPDENIGMSIPLNPQHKHAFVPESLRVLAEAAGLRETFMRNNYNGVSFVAVFEPLPHPVSTNGSFSNATVTEVLVA